MHSELKMRNFHVLVRTKTDTIDSIQGQPLEHHLISIVIVNHNDDLLIWVEAIVVVNIFQESSVSIAILCPKSVKFLKQLKTTEGLALSRT